MYDINWHFFTLYILLFLFTWWFYMGYLIFMFVRSSAEETEKYLSNKIFPTITLLIPCYNEELMIASKIKNSLALDYLKEKLTIIFIDGGSKDQTISIIKKYAKKNTRISLIQSKKAGKINQLNEILPHITSDIIVCTDVDGDLSKNSLSVIANALQDKKIGLVGITTIPQTTISEEEYFWKQQNRLRLAESKYYSPLYIIAVCYGFRKGLIETFPDDVIADDIYLSFLAIKKGLKTIYTDEATAKELRVPSTFSEFFTHKVRKTNAFLKELTRFFFPFFIAPLRWQLIFYTRAGQIFLGPFFLISLTIIFFYTALTSLTGLLPLLTIFSLVFTYLLFRPIAVRGFFKKIKTFLFIQFVLLYSLFTYAYYRQTSNYKKTG